MTGFLAFYCSTNGLWKVACILYWMKRRYKQCCMMCRAIDSYKKPRCFAMDNERLGLYRNIRVTCLVVGKGTGVIKYTVS